VRHDGEPIAVTAFGPDGNEAARAETAAAEQKVVTMEGQGYPVPSRREPDCAQLALPRARKGAVYRLSLEGGNKRSCALVLADADIVHHVPEKQAFFTQDLVGQYYTGSRFFVRTATDTITVVSQSPNRSPYTIRDAATWRELYRSNASDPQEIIHRLGKDRLIAFTVAGYGPWTRRSLQGVRPYLSATREGWLDPERHEGLDPPGGDSSLR
jgi:hypothetical protein